MKSTSTTSTRSADVFHRELRAAGLYFNRLGRQCARLMLRLQEVPLPFVPEGGRGKCNACGKALAPLIAAGLARLERESAAYVLTESGREWLRRFHAARLKHLI